MGPGQPYYGPIGMVDSRYASPQRRKQVEALLAANPELRAKKNAEDILVFCEQAPNNAVPDQSAGAQLVQAQTRALEQQITQHMHAVGQTVSTVAAKVRQIINLISDAINAEHPDTAALKVVENLRQEVNKLLGTTCQVQGALPYFLEKQKENSGLLTGDEIYEAHQDIRQELEQKTKIKLSQELVYGQQQALKGVEVDASNKNAEQQVPPSCLQMDLGLVRSEMDTRNDELKKAKAAEEDAANMRGVLEEKLIHSKESLSAENENIRGNIKGLEAELQAAKDRAREAAEDYQKQLLNLKGQLHKEQQKAVSVDNYLKTLRQADEGSRREVDKMKAELNLLSEKYNNQSTVYVKTAENLKEKTKKVDALDGEVQALQQQKADLEKQHSRVTFLKDTIQTQHGTLKSELDELKQKVGLAKDEAQQLSSKLKRTESENGEVKKENIELRAKQLEHNKTIAALKKGDAEIVTLRATVQSMQNKLTATNYSADVAALRKELQTLNEKLTQSEANRAEWEDLGRKAMLQYREMVPKNKQLEGTKKRLTQVLVENQELKAEGTIPSGSNGEAKYWRNKYNDLLAEMEK
ncbi:hypothetical protein DPSP01_000838 [Paraphaeosphaeria sporulosa]